MAKRALDQNAVPPLESYTPGGEVEHLGTPRFDSSARVNQGQRKGIGWGKGLALALAGLAAGAVGTVAIINATSTSEVGEQKPLSPAEQKALQNLDLMQQIAQRDGGGFKVTNWIGRQVEADNVRQVYNRIADGEAVYFYESEAEVPVEIKNFDDLHQVARDVGHRHNVAELKRAAEELEQAAREGLQELENAAREGVEKLKDIFK